MPAAMHFCYELPGLNGYLLKVTVTAALDGSADLEYTSTCCQSRLSFGQFSFPALQLCLSTRHATAAINCWNSMCKHIGGCFWSSCGSWCAAHASTPGTKCTTLSLVCCC